MLEGVLNYLPNKNPKWNGSFNHNFPSIYSVAAVSFPIYSATEAYLLLKDDKDFKIDEEIFFSSLEKQQFGFLKTLITMCNQETGSLMALYNIYLITGKEEYLEGVNKKIDNLLSFQSNEGWFLEYSEAI